MFFSFRKSKGKQTSIPDVQDGDKQDGAGSSLDVETTPVQDGADPTPSKPLDVVFLQDTTGSQGPYIRAAVKAIRDICDKISSDAQLSREQLRFGLIAFRDHPPQDQSYVTKSFGFTSNVKVIRKNLSSLLAAGGGDGPEAQTAALAEALQMDWAEDAIKMVILITDSPPHGLGESGDGFTESPDQNDPLEITRQMAEHGITLFVIACEPSLSRWKNAVDFYTALCSITSGRMFPLLMADKLGDFIIGTALETIETDKLVTQFEQVIVDDVYDKDKPVEAVVGNLQEYIKSRGIQLNTVVMDDVYTSSKRAKENVQTWTLSPSIALAKGKVQRIDEPRLVPTYEEFSASGAGPSHSYGALKIRKQDISAYQTHSIVKKSIAKNSTVTPTGTYSRKSPGKSLSSSDFFSIQEVVNFCTSALDICISSDEYHVPF